MPKSQVKPQQMSLMVNGIVYKDCYWVQGSNAFTASGDNDFDVDTGVPKFPNNLLAWGVTPGWTSVTWDQTWRKGEVYQNSGNANLRLSIHVRVGSTLSKDAKWWAVGN